MAKRKVSKAEIAEAEKFLSTAVDASLARPVASQEKPKKFSPQDFPQGASASEKLAIMGITDERFAVMQNLNASAKQTADVLADVKLVHTTREQDGLNKIPKLTMEEHAAHALELMHAHALEVRPSPIKPSLKNLGDLNQRVIELISYTDERVLHFGRAEREAGVGRAINARLADISMLINQIIIYNKGYDRETALRQACAQMRSMNQYIEVAFRRKLIRANHFDTWANMSVPIDMMMLGMAIYLQDEKAGKIKRGGRTTRSSKKAADEIMPVTASGVVTPETR